MEKMLFTRTCGYRKSTVDLITLNFSRVCLHFFDQFEKKKNIGRSEFPIYKTLLGVKHYKTKMNTQKSRWFFNKNNSMLAN